MSKKQILIIEDEHSLVTSMVTFFKSNGFDILAAYDALYGISLAHKNQVDVILLDLGIPAGGGFFVLDSLKSSPSTYSIPVIILTAKPGLDLEEIALRKGAAAFFHKPFDPVMVLEKIKESFSV